MSFSARAHARFCSRRKAAAAPFSMASGMLVNQGVIRVQYWTGIIPIPAVMRRALGEALDVRPAMKTTPSLLLLRSAAPPPTLTAGVAETRRPSTRSLRG